MKKHILLLSASCMALLSQAQSDTTKPREGFKKGDILFNGGLGLGFSDKQFYINAQPGAAYFLTRHIAAGIGLGFTHANSNFNSYNANGWNGSVFARYYTTPQARFSFFGQLSAGAGVMNSKFQNSSSFTEIHTFTNSYVAISPGINYFISRRVGIEVQFGSLGYYRTKESGGFRNDDVRLDLNLSSVKFGINFKL